MKIPKHISKRKGGLITLHGQKLLIGQCFYSEAAVKLYLDKHRQCRP